MFASTIFLSVTSLLMLGRMRTPEFFVGLLITFVLLLAFSKYECEHSVISSQVIYLCPEKT